MPLKEIVEQPGFDKLNFVGQKAVVNTHENFMVLSNILTFLKKLNRLVN